MISINWLKKSISLLSVCGLLTLTTSCKKDEDVVKTDIMKFPTVVISPMQEVPSVSSSASGTAMVEYDKISKKVSYTINYSGLTPTGMHFHKGMVGVAGGVEQEIKAPYSSGMKGTIATALTDAQIADLMAGNWYINIHTAANAGGEIRGQVLPDNTTLFISALNGANEKPAAVITEATGMFYGMYDKGTKMLHYSISLKKITPSAGHFHKGSASEAGPVLQEIPGPITDGKTGMATLTADQETDLFAGMVYVNLHTTLYTGGEIRGQLVK